MSTRYYPIYSKGNPQLRIFLPNFWMKLVRPAEKQPPNIVQFKVPTAMTNYDIRQYLEKIYKLDVVDIYSEIERGKLKEAFRNGYIVKEDDFRRVFVTLRRDHKFEFPNIILNPEKTKQDEEDKKMKDDAKRELAKYKKLNSDRLNVPHWFSL